jgi:GGDEF domain-containing protein
VPEGAFLARIGGDEFNLLLTDVKDPEDARLLASQIIRTINPPYSILDLQFDISASVGYAVSARGQWSPLEVVRHADVAMCHAKTAGAQEPVIYDKAF